MTGPQNETPSGNDTPTPGETPSEAPTRSSRSRASSSGAASAEPKPDAPAQPASSDAAGTGSAAAGQATAAVSSAMTAVRERLQTGEQLILLGAALIVLSYVLFQLILGNRVFSDITMLVAVLTLLAIWAHRWGHFDLGDSYRVLVGALGIVLALFAILNFLDRIRFGINAQDFQLLGILLFWVGGIMAGYGAWLLIRARN
ncbi:hypothetical protein BH23CHL8_BH23CHL8_04810 [soil metagenome]